MAINQTNYISIKNKVLVSSEGRDFSGLVFSKITMKTGADKKTDYETDKKVVSLTKEEIEDSFSDAGFLAFCKEYFAYNGGSRRITKLNLAFVGSDETANAAFGRVTGEFFNFGSFAFYGSDFEVGDAEDGGLLDVAKSNESNEYGWVAIIKTGASNQSSDSAALDGLMLTHLTHDITAAMAFYAAVDYTVRNASSTIDYKQFGGHAATVTTDSEKTTADNLRVNYIGLVQDYGTGMKFYQRGVNMDGTDLGVVRDACWINSEIVREYFNLQTSVPKTPANHGGCAMIRNIVTSVATRAIENGAILLDKPLDADKIAMINQYAGNETAADTVSVDGYYVDAKIVDGNKCQYTLIYAKGDHIQKVDGVHILA